MYFFICLPSCLQNYIPPESLTLSCPVCRQTSILPEKGVCALQNNFFITNLMEVWILIPLFSFNSDTNCVRPTGLSSMLKRKKRRFNQSWDRCQRKENELKEVGQSALCDPGAVLVRTAPSVKHSEHILSEWGHSGQSWLLHEALFRICLPLPTSALASILLHLICQLSTAK